MPSDAITLTPTATGHAFTRNPLMLTMPGTGRRVFSIYGQGYSSSQPAYKGEITAPATINLAEFIEAIVHSIEDPGENNAMISYGIQDGSINIVVTDGENTLFSREINAIRGGVSKQNYRRLNLAGTDIFEARFFNSACNFFLTTRTNDWRLSIKETELYPLVFFYPLQGTVSIQDIVSENTISLPAVSNEVDFHGKLCALNLKAVKQYFLEEYDILAGAFDVLVDDAPAARIAIQEAHPQIERYRLKFRNSYGAFEIIEITGSAQWAPSIEDDEGEGPYQRYIADIDDFSTERQRMSMRQVINISTGYKTNSELRFILDAIASDECYLLDINEEPIKVIVTAEDLVLQHHPNSPQSFMLELKPVDGDTCITDTISNAAMPTRGGVFSEQFSEQFD